MSQAKRAKRLFQQTEEGIRNDIPMPAAAGGQQFQRPADPNPKPLVDLTEGSNNEESDMEKAMRLSLQVS